MSNTVTLEFAGDATKLAQAGKKAESAVQGVGDSAKSSSDELAKASKESGNFTSKLGSLGAGISGVSGALDDAGGTLSAFSELQNASYERSQKQKRALVDVQQAQEDYNQAIRDSRQATIDAGQAQIDKQQADLDAAAALKQYNADVKEHGRNSIEARQDLIDLKQANQDMTQAVEDGNQAQRDASQATIDAKSATLDLADAQREAHPGDLSKWADQLNTVTPLLQGMVGIIGLVTAAQWAWDAAMDANPIGLIVIAVGALIGIIVLLVKHWDWVKKVGRAAWHGIEIAAEATWHFLQKIPGWIGKAFKAVVSAITWPFRTAFNLVADAWNHTVGSLRWTVPGWVPGIGGNTIGVPQLPHFHQGGTVPGAPGAEVLAVLQGGEEVTSRAGSVGGGDTVHVVVKIDRDTLLDVIAKGNRRGGPKLA
jgi:small-conductance mechanosensitive channel